MTNNNVLNVLKYISTNANMVRILFHNVNNKNNKPEYVPIRMDFPIFSFEIFCDCIKRDKKNDYFPKILKSYRGY